MASSRSATRSCRLANAADAFERVKRGGIDLVLSDIEMPGRAACRSCSRIKAHDPDIDVIMVTGVVDFETAVGTDPPGRRRLRLEAVQSGRGPHRRRADAREAPAHPREPRLSAAARIEGGRPHARARGQEPRGRGALRRARRVLREHARSDDHGARFSRQRDARALAARRRVRGDGRAGDGRRSSLSCPGSAAGAILHDVGKIGVSDAILRKPGKLDAAEWEEMKQHPEMGYRMLKHIRFLKPALEIVHCHQERWDGSGYPHGLKGDADPAGRADLRRRRHVRRHDLGPARTAPRFRSRPRATRSAVSPESSSIPRSPRRSSRSSEAVWRDIRERVHRQTDALGRGGRASPASSPAAARFRSLRRPGSTRPCLRGASSRRSPEGPARRARTTCSARRGAAAPTA